MNTYLYAVYHVSYIVEPSQQRLWKFNNKKSKLNSLRQYKRLKSAKANNEKIMNREPSAFLGSDSYAGLDGGFEAIVDRFTSLDDVQKAIRNEGVDQCGLIFGESSSSSSSSSSLTSS